MNLLSTSESQGIGGSAQDEDPTYFMVLIQDFAIRKSRNYFHVCEFNFCI